MPIPKKFLKWDLTRAKRDAAILFEEKERIEKALSEKLLEIERIEFELQEELSRDEYGYVEHH